jgi:hypothetical protein
MAEAEHHEITAALAKLGAQDAGAADDAGAALEWIAGEQGLRLVTQERIQAFCWYELAVKWLTSHEQMWRSRHAIANQALMTAGKLHPDKKVAKAARAALVKATSVRSSPRSG